MLGEGRLPNFDKLRRQGDYRRLTTSIPPQSPVAWSNFITGAGPGVHGIFDFIHRDPTKQASPYWSGNQMVAIDDDEEPWKLGDYQVPTVETRNELLRRGTPFWDYLDEAGIGVRLYRMPANYPPSKSKHGHMCCLSGMGVPDGLGGQGTYQHYASSRRRNSTGAEGYKLRLRRNFEAGAYVGRLHGPPNDFRVKKPDSKTRVEKSPELSVELRVYPDPANDVAKIIYVNEGTVSDENVELVLSVGQWSEWQEVRFLKTPVGPTFRTMVRFLLQEAHPEVRLYVSPLNFIPTAPAAVFSEPADFVEDIGEEVGMFYTQGFAEEFNALKHAIFNDEEYHVQAWQVLDERFKLLDYALDHFEDGLLYFYFSSSDLIPHMFWWDSDEKHPTRTREEARKYDAVIDDVYVKMDEALGTCMTRLGNDTTIIALSDHGFCNFRRGIAVNTWLRDEGYLSSKKGLFVDTDWSRTRAYSLGVNGSIYLNQRGREKQGIVSLSERGALLDEISKKLMNLIDPETGRRVLRRVYRSEECYSGPEVKNAPDLVLGYERGYRASWNTCLGDFDDGIIIDNTSAWSADHCIAHDLVPGVIFSNRKIPVEQPALIDVAPTVLSVFGIAPPAEMTGGVFFDGPAAGTIASNVSDKR
jgi:predicted AlkP superfamily phosphohydrolase/phosphomutase